MSTIEFNNKTVLVTGGTGFLGSYCILQLLQQGYNVKTTIRNMAKKEEVVRMMKTGSLLSAKNLSFIQADLTRDDHWAEAVKDCVYVLHVASLIALAAPKHEH